MESTLSTWYPKAPAGGKNRGQEICAARWRDVTCYVLHVTRAHPRCCWHQTHLVPWNIVVRRFQWQLQTFWALSKILFLDYPAPLGEIVTDQGWWSTIELITGCKFLKLCVLVIAWWSICPLILLMLGFDIKSKIQEVTPTKYLKTINCGLELNPWKQDTGRRLARSLLEFRLIETLQIHDMFCLQFFPWSNW